VGKERCARPTWDPDNVVLQAGLRARPGVSPADSSILHEETLLSFTADVLRATKLLQRYDVLLGVFGSQVVIFV